MGAQYLRSNVIALSEAESVRVRRFVARVGNLETARRRLGIGDQTMEAARDCGRMQRSTRARLLAALEREECS